MPYTPKKEEKPAQTHKGFEQQRAEYKKMISGGNTSRSTIPEGLHPQAPRSKGYPKRPK